VVAVLLSLAGLILYRQIVAAAGFPPEIRGIAETFLRIFAIALGANYLLLISNALFRASGDVKKPLVTMFFVMAVNYNILGRLGEASIIALAAIANGLRIEVIIFLPAFVLNMTASVLIGQNLGAGNPDRAERTGWRIAAAGIVILSLMAVVVFIRAEDFAALVARDPAVLEETVRYLRYNMIGQPFIALSLSLGGGLQGAGDTRGTMWVIVIAMWLIRLPLAWTLALPLGLGAAGVRTAMVVSTVCQGLLIARRFHGGRWKELKLEPE
jgi:multidrug resistance protein, MATE family